MSDLSNQPNVSAAFTSLPANPFLSQSSLPHDAGAAKPQPQPAPAPTHAANPVFPASPQATPAQPAPVVQPEPAQPAPATPAPDYDPAMMQEMQMLRQQLEQMQQHNQQLQNEVAVRDRAMHNMAEENVKFRESQRAQNLDSVLTSEFLEGLESVSPEDAKKIASAVLQVTEGQLSPLRERLTQHQESLHKQGQYSKQVAEDARRQTLISRVLQAHPDYYQLQHTKEYKDFMSQPDGPYSSKTRDARAAEEFAAGNTDYVVHMLNQLKGAVPAKESITSVPPVQVATGNAASMTAAPQFTLRELNTLMGTGQITQDEYIKRLKELRAAQNPSI